MIYFLTLRVFFGYHDFMEALINEKICVVSLFGEGKIKPILFSWRKRIYRVLRVVFTYSKNIGKEKTFYFSVVTEVGSFEISFNQEKFSWEMEKIFGNSK